MHALALQDSTIGNGLYAAAAFDLFHENLLDAATGANDWMYFGASDLLAQTVPQIAVAWSRPEDESMTMWNYYVTKRPCSLKRCSQSG